MRFISYVISLVVFGFVALWLGGYHVVHKRPDWQLFGCKETYKNSKGEDTGECQ